ncbi:MAG: aminoacyl-tRNA hydrolase [Candidatus Daviesbacteria bacterium]|nr:aminoacyl-tRNA hydrolase [Candidatus Daviesbacteria bacterium]
MKLIVGLGNPGDKRSLRSGDLKYVGTRHNLGFVVANELVDRLQGTGDSWNKSEKLKSEICNLKTTTCNLIIAKPQTYMNNSGMAVKLLASYYKIAPEDIIIIHDELDLPLGKIKVRIGGAAAGHHGVESVMEALGTDQFIRVRLGIGNLKTQSSEHKGQSLNAEKFVLEPFIHSEKPQVKHMIKQAIKALDLLLEKGLEKAQNQYN